MLLTSQQKSLSKRGSKLLVEVVIGVIGLLGIMVAQSGSHQEHVFYSKANGEVVSVEQSESKIDWLDILF
ncbi:MAG: hypothetical protein OQK51_11505 [Kangiellaceae bacterium]|nr:hypothetical protein [Kangiellaceae bacterium]